MGRKNLWGIVFLFLLSFLSACGPPRYKVEFILDDEVYFTSSSYGYGFIEMPEVPLKEGYVFQGWYFDYGVWEDRLTFDTFLERKLDTDLKVYGKWGVDTLAEYTITYDLAGGEWEDGDHPLSIVVKEGDLLSWPPNAVKYGCDLLEWLISDHRTNFGAPIYGDLTITAMWSDFVEPIVDYTITFDLDGGTLYNSDTYFDIVPEGGEVYQPLNPIKDGYIFVGWFLNEEEYVFSSKVYGEFTIVAKWEAIPELPTYTITYDVNGGVWNDSLHYIQQYTEGEYGIPPNNPTKEGFEFVGWSLDDEFYDFSQPITSNITLVAKWQRIIAEDEELIRFDTQGGIWTDDSSAEFVCKRYSHIEKPADPIKEGYVFFGWSTEPNSYKNNDFDFRPIYYSSVFYAIWVDENNNAGLKYTLGYDNNHYYISGYEGDCEALVLPVSYEGLPVSWIGANAFANNATLKAVYIPNSYHTIGANAFAYCMGLENVVFEKEGILYKIDDNAFRDCDRLETIDIIASVRVVGEHAFADCRDLINIKFEENSQLQEIRYAAFASCSYLEKIVLPDSVTLIDDMAFLGCKMLSEIILPASLITIGDDVFNNCSNLREIIIPNNVETIGEFAFLGCGELHTVTISADSSLRSIGENAFLGSDLITEIFIPKYCNDIASTAFLGVGLVAIIVDSNNIEYTSVDGVLFNKDKTELVCYPSGKLAESYEIMKSVVTIKEYAFSFTTNLISLTFESNSALEIMESYAFSWAKSIQSIILPEGLRIIENSVFYCCDSLLSITIPASCEEIGSLYFKTCMNIEAINVDPNNLIYCSVDGVLFTKDKTTLLDYPNGKRDTSYTISRYVTTLANECFSSSYFEELLFEANSNLTTIGIRAIANCNNLVEITLPKKLLSISEGTFADCSKLANVFFEEGSVIEAISHVAFSKCVSLTSFNIPQSVLYFGEGVFRNSGLKRIFIPKNITYLNYEIFAHCYYLEEVVFEEESTLMTIHSKAFAYCSSLITISIPSSVVTIEANIFEGCENLVYVYVEGRNNLPEGFNSKWLDGCYAEVMWNV